MNLPDLTRFERRVFSAVYAYPHNCLMDLAELIGEDPARTARTVHRLERLGLVESEVTRLDASRHAPPVRLRLCRPAPWTTA